MATIDVPVVRGPYTYSIQYTGILLNCTTYVITEVRDREKVL